MQAEQLEDTVDCAPTEDTESEQAASAAAQPGDSSRNAAAYQGIATNHLPRTTINTHDNMASVKNDKKSFVLRPTLACSHT